MLVTLDAHNKSVEELLKEHQTSEDIGLSSQEASRRLETHGPNDIPSGPGINPLKLLLEQFTDLLVLILIGAGLITAVIGIVEEDPESVIDVVAIVLVVLLNAFLGFYQEYSAEKAINSLKKLSTSEVVVYRDEHKIKIPVEEVVKGDIVFLEAGEIVPADLRLIQGYEIRVDEGILTGESMSVRKRNTVLPQKTQLADRTNMLYKGTTIVNGTGQALVVATGLGTELGKIASSLSEIHAEETPLQKKLAKLAKQLTLGVVVLSVLIMIFGFTLLKTDSPSDIFIFAIGLAVAAVPEGLPAVLTLTLAIGVTRMAKKQTLIRKLPAVEVLGSATVICTDKTGTLTKNEMTVKVLWTNDGLYNVTGVGYLNNGDLTVARTGHVASPSEDDSLDLALDISVLVNDASIQEEEGPQYKVFGDPTEIALLVMGAKAGYTAEKLKKQWEKKFVFPFDSERKRMSVVLKNKQGEGHRVMAKGAADVLLDLCTQQLSHGEIIPLEENDKKAIQAIAESYSGNYAYRVLGLAYRDLDDEETEKIVMSEDYERSENELVFVGLVAMIDPPRDQSGPSIRRAKSAGVNVIMITGDHMATAQAIGRSIGLTSKTDPAPITGQMLDEMSDEGLEEAVRTTKIFARVNPSHKLRIVNALKRQDEVVVMTGDGVNDAPALKRADVGVAMGITGTDVSKEASAMVLVDDNFANIVEAIAEGRVIYDNMKKFIAFLLSANMGEIITVMFGIIIGFILLPGGQAIIPLLAIQLLFINLVTDTFPAIALGVDTPEDNVMERSPRNPNEPLLDKNLLSMIVVSGIVFAVGSLFCFFYAIDFGNDFTEHNQEIARTMAFTALVIYQLLHALNTSEKGTIFSLKTIKNRTLLAAIALGLFLQLGAVYIVFLNPILETVPLEPFHWGLILLTAIPVVVVEEIRKKVFHSLQS